MEAGAGEIPNPLLGDSAYVPGTPGPAGAPAPGPKGVCIRSRGPAGGPNGCLRETSPGGESSLGLFQNGGMGGDATLDFEAESSMISVGAPDPGLLASNSRILRGLSVGPDPPEPADNPGGGAAPGGEPLFMTG